MFNNGAGGASAAPNENKKIPVLVVGLTVLLGVMLMAFALPAARSAPHDVPVGVVGPAPAVAALQSKADGFDISSYDDEAAARDAILHREIYGALVLQPNGDVHTLVATAGSVLVATGIEAIGNNLAEAQHGTATVTDLKSFPDKDPRGAGLAAGALPIALGGWIGAVVIMMMLHSFRGRLIAVASFAVVGGLGLTAVLQFIVGTFDGNYWLTSLAAMLGIAATAMMVLGLRELLGGLGLGIAAILLILLGNPLSGLSSAPEMLPTPWGWIGQLLPPGATGSLLRDVVFFEGHGATHAFVVLVCWFVAGSALFGIAEWRNRNRPEPDGPEHLIAEAIGEDEATGHR
ncbi:hypothetical protein AAFP30_11635 [Gordonia sp. CPCC 205515]|uniref:hypothetical protein n=1 Tax=Gordonia sp. CPCC 205515 TaxID=3140791 RepID=UPI003AF3312A